MAKQLRTKKPIMTPAEERFMAFEGLLQWAQAVTTQSARVSAARDRLTAVLCDPVVSHQAVLMFHFECHFFVIAAFKFIEYREWISTFALCSTVDFSEIDRLPKQGIKDLRNMREHVVEYFDGRGKDADRWAVQTSKYKADASSVFGTMIGGRLDWIKFSKAVERLLPKLFAEPIPYPSP